MNLRLLIAFVTVWLCHFSSAAQSPSFQLPTINEAAEGSTITVPVTVQDFDSIVSIGMVIQWDPSVIRYIGASDFNLIDFDQSDLGINDVYTTGQLRIVWWLFSFAGFNIPDGDILLNLRFQVIGPINSGTPIEFTEIDPNLIYEIQKASGQTFSLQDSELTDGFVAIGYTVFSEDFPTLDFSWSFAQNPLRGNEQLRLFFQNPNASKKITLALIDPKSGLLHTKTFELPSGQSDYVFPTSGGLSDGLYIVNLTDGHRNHSKKILITN